MINKKNTSPPATLVGSLLLVLSALTPVQALQTPQTALSATSDTVLYDQAQETDGHQAFDTPPHLLDSYIDLGNLLHSNMYSMLLDDTDFIKLQDMVRQLWQKQMQPERIVR